MFILISNESYIHVTKCNDGNTYVGFGSVGPAGGPVGEKAYIVNAADLLAGHGNENKMTIEGAWKIERLSQVDGGERIEETYRSFNGASEVFITTTGQVIVSDTDSGRVIIWNYIEDAITEYRDKTKKSIAILGLGENDYTFFDVRDSDATNIKFHMPDDKVSIESRNTLFSPKFIDYDGKYLWIGNFKFAGGIKRFSGIL